MDAIIGLGSTPFYTGELSAAGDETSPDTGTVTRTVPDTVTLDGWTYAIERAEYEFGPQDTFRDGVVASDEPNDSIFNARGSWSRYRISWHHGADQEIADLDPDADPYRFEQSFGFDPWSKYQLKLLPRARVNDDWTGLGGTPILLRSGTYLWVADGSTLERSISGGSTAGTGATAPGGTIQSMASDGHDLYVATSTVMKKYVDTDTTPTAFTTPVVGNCTKVAFVANRLLLAKANVLYEVAADGSLGTAVATHYQASFQWTTIFAVGSRIYIGGYAGVKSELYTLATDSTGALVQSQEAAPLPIGEQLLCGLAVGGAVLLGTTAGVRFAQLGADGTLTYGPLIDKLGTVYALAAEGRYVYATWNDTTTSLSGRKGIARLDLGSFTGVLQPAYAADVQVPAAAGDVLGVERYEGYTWFTVADDSLYWAASDGYFESEPNPSLVLSAEITSGIIFFGTVEPKGLVEMTVTFEELPVGATVEVSVFDQLGGLVGYGAQDVAGTTELTIPLNGRRTSEARVTVEVSGAGNAQVVLRTWRLRAYPVPPQSLQWVVPVNTHESAQIGESAGRKLAQGPREVLDRIEALHSSRRLVTYMEGDRAYRVRVESFKHKARKWSADGSALQGICYVQLVAV